MASNGKHHKDTFQNYVRKDGVIKEQVGKENSTRGNYESRWGLLDSNKICLEIAKEEGIDAQDFRRMAARCIRRKKPPADDVDPYDDGWKLPSSGPMPTTTTGEIGRRSSRASCNLEFYGPLYRSPKETMMPLFYNDHVIFLG